MAGVFSGMMRFALPLLLSCAVLAGCASFDRQELAQLRSRGVPPPIMAKLAQDRPLAPADVISLNRHGMPVDKVVWYIHRNGIDYALTHADAVRMRSAGVNVRVIDALAEESKTFEGDYGGRPGVVVGVSGYDPYGYGYGYEGYGRYGYGPGYGYPFGRRYWY